MLDAPSPTDPAAPASPEARLAEYAALRAEIVSHLEFRHRFTEITVVATAAVLGLGLTSEELVPILLVYPVFVSLLYVSWANSGLVIAELAAYIKDELEGPSTGLGWEHYLSRQRRPGRLPFGVLEHWGATGLFLTTELIAIASGAYLAARHSSYTGFERVLTAVGLIGLVVTVVLAGYAIPRLTRDPSPPTAADRRPGRRRAGAP